MAGRGQGGFDSNAGKKVGLEIWRIENMNPVRSKDPPGTFYTGDAYIVLNTKKDGNALAWDLHFWLGAECSQDEYGAAALRTVELDDQLGGGPVQFREVDGHESQAFKGLFKNMTLKSGGVASAFNKVDRDSYPTRLFHLKGKRQVRCQQVKLEAASMNEGDVFILDMGLKMYQWNGKDANKYEKFKGLEMMKKINDSERGGRAEQIFLESGKDANPDFWKGIGVSSGTKPSIAAATEDSAANTAKPPALFQISDSSGSLEMKEIARGSLEHSMLDENDVFLVDSGSVISVWVGKGASKEERRKSMEYATKYMADNGIENWTPCNRVPMNGETPAFKSLFKNWPEPKSKSTGAAAPAAKKGPDTTQLYGRNKKEEEKMYSIDGKVEVWRVNNFKREAMDPSLYGQFWAGDSFIVLYSYKVNTKDAWIIYFWQGRDSSIDEKGASALIAKEMDDELGGDPVQVRVVQNKEPKHFLALFKGKMIVHQGGVASGFKNIKAQDSFDTDGISLFHVKGTNAFNTRAVQVAENASQLNSGDCFVLLTPKIVYEWYGKFANAEEKAACSNSAKIISAKQGGKTTKVDEGKEDGNFWEALGGQADYPKDKPVETADHEPRLFQMSCNIGHFNVEEIFDFVQDDLIDDDIMMLDVFTEVYVWVGREASREEKDLALTTAMDYIKNAPDGRSADTPVFRVSSGFEPPNFTQWFLGWDASKTKAAGEDPYLKALAAKGGAVGKGGLASVSKSMVGYAKPSDKFYSLDALKNNTGLDNVDPKNKELYLSDSDFQAAFGMGKAEFAASPGWKQAAAKKKFGIF